MRSKPLNSFISLWLCRIILCIIILHAGEISGAVIEDIERALPYLDDTDMAELSNRIIEKLRNMTDEEFERLELIEAD